MNAATILIFASLLSNGHMIVVPSDTGNEFKCEIMKKNMHDLIDDEGNFLKKIQDYNRQVYNQETKTVGVGCVTKDKVDSFRSKENFVVENYRDLTN